ncbi:MAG: helix-turn-helix domain-containing protein [Paenibacillaceae bacterium]
MNSEKVANDFFQALVEKLTEHLKPILLEELKKQISTTGPDRTLSIEEAGEYMGISYMLLYRMCKEKSIPHMRAGVKGSKKPKILFCQSSLDKWKRQQEQENYQAEKLPL